MEVYRTDKPYSYTNLLRDEALFLCMVALIYMICFLWVPERVTAFSWIFPTVLFLTDILRKISQDRLQQLYFDTENKEVIISYKSMLSAVKQKRISFSQARLEVSQSKPSKLCIFEPLTIYFMKEKMEVFELRRSKDGLSVDVLSEIVQDARTLSIPVKSV